MSLIKHKIDPLGDTVITLRNPGAPFALGEWGTEIMADVKYPFEVGKETKIPQPVPEQSASELSRKQLRSMNQTRRPAAEASGSNASPAPLEVETERTNGVLNEEPEATTASTVNDHKDSGIQYLVSSRHLMLVSPWFRRRFTSDTFSESTPNPSDGRYHFSASDWDEGALLILLNIFHLRTRQVPASISLEMFAEIAVIADYYELEDEQAMDREVKNWVERLWITDIIPNTYCRDLVLWICISRVFRLTEQFEQVTAVAIKASCGWIQDLGLPVHQDVTSGIDRIRCHAIEQIIANLHRLAERYGDSQYVCPRAKKYSFQCGSSLYGALMRHMKDWGYLTPRPVAPFAGMCFNDVRSIVKKAQSPKWWHAAGSDNSRAHPCDLSSELDTIVKNAHAEIKGLRLVNGYVIPPP